MNEALDIRLTSKEIAFDEIPVIDVASLIDGSNPQWVAEQIKYVCEQVGFMYIRNHGVPRQLIDRMYTLTQQFFALPQRDKDKLNIIHSGQTLRGYIPFYGENVDPEHTRDFKESFDFGIHETEVSPFFGPNLMPEGLPEFKTCCENYHAVMMSLAKKLVSAIALSLGLDADYFEKLQRKPITIQRILHYPPQTGSISQDEIGIGAHTDYGFLTILSQDEVGGLQVKNRADEWISAPPIEGTFIVNIGDLVQTLTNDRYISTLHRVINRGGKERYSIPFFLDLDFDAVVEPVPGCASDEHPSRYTPYTCGQHKYRRFVDSYSHLQSTVGE